MKPKVIWTPREWKLVASWFTEQGVDIDDRGFAKNLDAAQKSKLPADRHRYLVRQRVGRDRSSIEDAPWLNSTRSALPR